MDNTTNGEVNCICRDCSDEYIMNPVFEKYLSKTGFHDQFIRCPRCRAKKVARDYQNRDNPFYKEY